MTWQMRCSRQVYCKQSADLQLMAIQLLSSSLFANAGHACSRRYFFRKQRRCSRRGFWQQPAQSMQSLRRKMPLRTQLGGQARLQHAICLDSLGQGQEAHSIYRSLSRHPTSFVAKRANQVRLLCLHVSLRTPSCFKSFLCFSKITSVQQLPLFAPPLLSTCVEL